jgi:hypothetical protein
MKMRRMTSTAITADTLRAQRIDAAKRVIELVTEGQKLTEAVKQAGMTLTSFHAAISSERELGPAYARAQEIRADVLVDEAIEAADSNDDPAKARNKMNIRQWAASKYNSKRYGERIDLNINQQISIDGALSEAKRRVLRPVSDQLDVTDVEPHAPQALPAPGATDQQSVLPSIPQPADPEPDIFS